MVVAASRLAAANHWITTRKTAVNAKPTLLVPGRSCSQTDHAASRVT
jgi:hypothetical protein